ncbi:MAG: hypothetical protein AVO33_00830 [delta proteobacterium ML8_F1]|nr:MAG: hypothetical protein AVO33_00830 [delta proteobacterium ML8_F1]
MCTVILGYKVHKEYPLVIIGNRDEFYNRPARAATLWPDRRIVAGKDLAEGGTWMGASKSGRFGVITNYRDFSLIKPNCPSRGLLLREYLEGSKSFQERLLETAQNYNPYNMIFGDLTRIHYFSSVKRDFFEVDPGIHGLSNRHLDTPWEKVTKAKAAFGQALEKETLDISRLFEILSDTEKTYRNLPVNTHVPREKEYDLSSIFIDLEDYGTRHQTVVLFHRGGTVFFYEKSRFKDKWRNNFILFTLDGFSPDPHPPHQFPQNQYR